MISYCKDRQMFHMVQAEIANPTTPYSVCYCGLKRSVAMKTGYDCRTWQKTTSSARSAVSQLRSCTLEK